MFVFWGNHKFLILDVCNAGSAGLHQSDLNSLSGPMGSGEGADAEQGPATQDALDGLDGLTCEKIGDRTHFSAMFVKRADALAECKLCGKIVTNMKNHYLVHNPGHHRCVVCGAEFTRMDSLKRHVRKSHDLFPEHFM
ncbi:Fruitless H1 isoform [Gryllus bimaculatus]|nr:Fruitless H1 isoform [Gryllus bimaculatus]